jgi:uncharacterized protein (DUF433 family)
MRLRLSNAINNDLALTQVAGTFLAMAAKHETPETKADSYRYIIRTAGICGGKARIEDTRITVHDVIGLLQNGETIDTIGICFPDVTRAQVYECLAYYEDHRAEIDYLVAEQMAGPHE